MLCFHDIETFQSSKYFHKGIENLVVKEKLSELIFTPGLAIQRNLAKY